MPAKSEARGVPCRVEFYAGSRAEETPRRVIWREHSAAVEKVLGRRRVMDKVSRKTSEEFTVILEGRTVMLRRKASGRWSLILPGA
jgi:hypothetical protein